MRQTSIILLFAFVLAGTTPALAQRRVPNTGMGSIGASIGAALPTETNLENGLELAGNLEGYLTPRVSIRGQVGTAWLDFTGGAATARPLFVDGNVVYNWEGGQWHPYVTGGIGYYRYHVTRGSATDSNAGFDLGAGFEYFFTRRSRRKCSTTKWERSLRRRWSCRMDSCGPSRSERRPIWAAEEFGIQNLEFGMRTRIPHSEFLIPNCMIHLTVAVSSDATAFRNGII